MATEATPLKGLRDEEIVKLLTTPPCKIKKFLDEFSHIMIPDDKARLERLHKRIEKLRNTKVIKNKFGHHYEDCRWSDENTRCGPDTCKCFRNSVAENEADADKIINMYYYIYNKIKDTK